MSTTNNFELFSLVTERPDSSLTRKTICPFCSSKDVEEKGHEQTLTGFNNHNWVSCSCNSCGKQFVHEFKDGGRGIKPNHWYTDENHKVLKGIPACFEHYIYTCCHCGGDVHRTYKNLDGHDFPDGTFLLKTTIENGKMVKQYRIFFECTKCGASVETQDDHWRQELA